MPVLYDVHTVTPGTSVAGQFLLRAPIGTLVALWRLHPDAVRRIEQEAVAQPGCFLHDNNRGKFPSDRMVVTVAQPTFTELELCAIREAIETELEAHVDARHQLTDEAEQEERDDLDVAVDEASALRDKVQAMLDAIAAEGNEPTDRLPG